MKTLLSYTFFNRLGIVIIGLFCLSLIGYLKPSVRGGDVPTYTFNQGDHLYVYREPTNNLIHMWSVWDTKRYISIAEDGYSKQRAPFKYTDNKGFLPLYPILLWFFGTFIFFGNTHIAGIFLSNLFLVLALVFFRKLVHSEPTLKDSLEIKDVWWYVLLFPTSYYLSAIYPESLFVCLSILVFYFARKKSFVLASLMFSLACLTKTFGLFLIIPIIFELLKHRRDVPIKKVVSCIAAAAALPLIYCAYMYQISGDPFAYIHIQQMFFRHSWREPIHVIIEAIYGFGVANTWNNVFVFFSLITIGLSFKKIPRAYSIYALTYILFTPLTGVLDGSSRYMASLFVLPIALAVIVKSQEKKKYLLMAFSLVQGFAILWWVIGAGFAS